MAALRAHRRRAARDAVARFGTWLCNLRALALEVISPSSARTDRITKRDYYLDVGVPDYFIVDVDARIIECWTQGRDTPLVLRDELVWQPAGARTPLRVVLPEFFDRISEKLRRIGVRDR